MQLLKTESHQTLLLEPYAAETTAPCSEVLLEASFPGLPFSHGTSGGWRSRQHEDKAQPESLCSYCSVTDKTTATQRERHSARGPSHQEGRAALLGMH